MIPNSFALRTSLKSFVLNSSVTRFIITLLLPHSSLLLHSSLCLQLRYRRCLLLLSDKGQRSVLLQSMGDPECTSFPAPSLVNGCSSMDVACMHIAQLCCSSTVLSYLFPFHLPSFISFLFLWIFLFWTLFFVVVFFFWLIVAKNKTMLA